MAGGKPLALLIPGLDGSGLLYYRQIGALSERYRPVAWRFRAAGEFDISDLVRELGEGTEGEAPRSILVVGESFGGVLAMHYVLEYPERVRRLILVNTFARYPCRLRIRAARALAPLLRFRLACRIKDYAADRILAREGIAPADLQRYREIVRGVDLRAYRRRLELVERADVRRRLGEIAVPTVILAAGRDKLVPSIRQARYLASRIPQATVHEFPHAGHALLLTPGVSLAAYAEESILNRRRSRPGGKPDDLEAGEMRGVPGGSPARD
jgi:pimeloyl-ACP methyl ester carboxylesterase